MRVVLASGSPRRRELLKKIYDEFEKMENVMTTLALTDNKK